MILFVDVFVVVAMIVAGVMGSGKSRHLSYVDRID